MVFKFFNRTDSRVVILKLMIVEGLCYGSDMMKANGRIKRGSVYVLLRRMIEEGLAERRSGSYPGHPEVERSAYFPTAAGYRVYETAVRAERKEDFGILEPKGATG